jgi:parallel beta-helix repeat protein
MLTVESNGILELKDVVVEIDNANAIVVKPGGKLIVDGSQINSKTWGFWAGIEMHGVKTASQTPANQPVVELKNGAVIENALCGVFVGNPANAGNAGGGILYAFEAEFKNCKNGIKMDPYTPTNLSYIFKCRFETNGNYADISQGPDAAVLLWGVKNVNVKGNVFVNSAPSVFQVSNRGNGLLIKGSTSAIEPYGQAAQIKNSFSNLNHAIYIVAATTVADVSIVDNVFTNNQYAVRASGSYKGKAVLNSIALSSGDSYGFYVSSSNNFKIEENTIVGSMSGYGIHVINSGGAPEIYKNTISNTTRGIYLSNNPGLKVTCNELNNNVQQVYINADGAYWSQGTSAMAAGN